MIATQAGPALAFLEATSRQDERVQQLQALNEIGRLLSGVLDSTPCSKRSIARPVSLLTPRSSSSPSMIPAPTCSTSPTWPMRPSAAGNRFAGPQALAWPASLCGSATPAHRQLSCRVRAPWCGDRAAAEYAIAAVLARCAAAGARSAHRRHDDRQHPPRLYLQRRARRSAGDDRRTGGCRDRERQALSAQRAPGAPACNAQPHRQDDHLIARPAACPIADYGADLRAAGRRGGFPAAARRGHRRPGLHLHHRPVWQPPAWPAPARRRRPGRLCGGARRIGDRQRRAAGRTVLRHHRHYHRIYHTRDSGVPLRGVGGVQGRDRDHETGATAANSPTRISGRWRPWPTRR